VRVAADVKIAIPIKKKRWWQSWAFGSRGKKVMLKGGPLLMSAIRLVVSDEQRCPGQSSGTSYRFLGLGVHKDALCTGKALNPVQTSGDRVGGVMSTVSVN
jgi:hypothetical protein